MCGQLLTDICLQRHDLSKTPWFCPRWRSAELLIFVPRATPCVASTPADRQRVEDFAIVDSDRPRYPRLGMSLKGGERTYRGRLGKDRSPQIGRASCRERV